MRYFNRVILQTPESVELEFVLAGIGNRALALAIDYLILTIFLILFPLLWLAFSAQLFTYLDGLNINYSGLALWLVAIALLLIFIVWVGYFVIFETLWQGQTPGKRFAKIRVICDDGRPVRLPQALLRALLRPVDDMLSVGAWLIMLSKREKRLGDFVAGTLVVQNQQPIALDPISLSAQAQPLAEQLGQVVNLALLMPDDFAVIREYLQRRSLMTPQAQQSISLKLAHQVQAVIKLEHLPQDLTANSFLEAIYLAYQQQLS